MKTSLLALAFGGLASRSGSAAAAARPDNPRQQDQTRLLPVQPPTGGWRRFGDGQTPGPNQQRSLHRSNHRSNLLCSRTGADIRAVTRPPCRPIITSNRATSTASVPAACSSGLSDLPAGTWLTVRTTNPLSTDHNQVGDAFSAVLTEPIVVNGFVVARRGQVVQGRISTVEKAGRVSGTSKLGLELTQVTLVDGQQITLHSQMVTRDGGTSYGRDATAIGATTLAGAAIGAGVNGGVGAGVGAAGGLVASTVGVLLTRGKPSVIYPETVLTFKVVDPITISTANSACAFRPVGQQDYDNNTRQTW